MGLRFSGFTVWGFQAAFFESHSPSSSLAWGLPSEFANISSGRLAASFSSASSTELVFSSSSFLPGTPAIVAGLRAQKRSKLTARQKKVYIRSSQLFHQVGSVLGPKVLDGVPRLRLHRRCPDSTFRRLLEVCTCSVPQSFRLQPLPAPSGVWGFVLTPSLCHRYCQRPMTHKEFKQCRWSRTQTPSSKPSRPKPQYSESAQQEPRVSAPASCRQHPVGPLT